MIKSDKGFTFMELVVIMAIIGILLAISAPVYISHKRTACDTLAEEHLYSMIAPWQKYIHDALNAKRENPRKLEDLAGTFYGWSGGSSRCGLRFFYDTTEKKMFCAALDGSRPRGFDTRYMYFFETEAMGGSNTSRNISPPPSLYVQALEFMFAPRAAYAQSNTIQIGIVTEGDMASWTGVPGGQGCTGTAFDASGNYVGCP